MGTYNIPRNTKGEGRFLYIFSTKALIYTVIGAFIGLPIYFFLGAFNVGGIVRLIVLAVSGFIGFSIATFKFPEVGALRSSTSIGGESIDDVIRRFFMFRKKNSKVFVNMPDKEKEEKKETKEEKING